MTLILIVSTLSIMIFYSAVITVNIHRTLDRENAGKALRVLFPSYFLTISIISFMALITSIINIELITVILFFNFNRIKFCQFIVIDYFIIIK